MSDPPASETLLKAALVRRAMTDVSRIIRLCEDKPTLQSLLQKGSIGDDLWNGLLPAEKELEANAYVEGWGSVIFQTATEMMHNEKMRTLVEQSLPFEPKPVRFMASVVLLQPCSTNIRTSV